MGEIRGRNFARISNWNEIAKNSSGGSYQVSRMASRSLEGWRRRREGPPYLKFGRRVKYRIEDIEAYKAARLRDNNTAQQNT